MSSADTSLRKRYKQDQAARTSGQGQEQANRAICLAGGGPVAGLHIGALHALKQHGIDFQGEHDVWALSCIGAWVGIVYNQFEEGDRAQQTYEFFRDNVYRDDETFESFPINRIFGPDWTGNADALKDFLLDPANYKKLFSVRSAVDAAADTLWKMSLYRHGRKWNEGNFNGWVLNDIMAINPFVRFMTSMIYKSKISGLTKLNFPGSDFLNQIKFNNLYEKPKKQGEATHRKPPYIFHNAWNLSRQKLNLFCNDTSGKYKDEDGEPYRPITSVTVCACSALPYIEQTVEIDDEVYCEGALVDTVNFKNLLKDHGQKLNEVWISRIVDAKQIRKPKNLYDSLANLCELFASTVGEDDVSMFKSHVRENNRTKNELTWKGTIVEIRTASDVNYDWSRKNLKRGCETGARAAKEAYLLYEAYKHRAPTDGVLMIPDDLKDEDFTALNLKPPARDDMGRIVHHAT